VDDAHAWHQHAPSPLPMVLSLAMKAPGSSSVWGLPRAPPTRVVPLRIYCFLLGLVSSKATEIEPAEELVSVSTTQQRKFELIAEVAHQVW
jgi:hypothetical protein